MKLIKVGKLFIYLLIASLLLFAFFGNDLLFLAKLISLSIALTLLYAIYLSKGVRYVKPGDEVIIIGARYIMGRRGKALTRARLHDKIRVKLYDGKEAEGVVESLGGLITPAIVSVVYEEELIK